MGMTNWMARPAAVMTCECDGTPDVMNAIVQWLGLPPKGYVERQLRAPPRLPVAGREIKGILELPCGKANRWLRQLICYTRRIDASQLHNKLVDAA